MVDETVEELEKKIEQLGQESARLGLWMESVESKKGVSTYTIAKNITKSRIKDIDSERKKLKNRLKVKLANRK